MPTEFSYSYFHQVLVSVRKVSTFCLIEIIVHLRIFPRSSFQAFAERTEVRDLTIID